MAIGIGLEGGGDYHVDGGGQVVENWRGRRRKCQKKERKGAGEFGVFEVGTQCIICQRVTFMKNPKGITASCFSLPDYLFRRRYVCDFCDDFMARF